ncbi:cell wall-active antibiotics response protein LiaF [Cohnella sp. AR92]|uniref:cell wall-active antibiotics response protein LiaF n=1 Tax=Cohnella sp. AR92 TaxID=648716 RepID=UPI001315994C|nr:cell wall-active antibiotics response protein LiaF [Cohnella sp. AR92]
MRSKLSSHALLFIAAGLYLALGGLAGFATVNAILLLVLGIMRYREDRNRLAIVVVVISALVLFANQIGLVVVVVLISLGLYFLKSRHSSPGKRESRPRFFLKLKKDRESWLLPSMSYWHAFGEVRLDLSTAIPEEKETVIVLQGLIGDIDLIVPVEYGVELEASAMLGQIVWDQRQQSGGFQRVKWRSPDYENKEQQVKLQLVYLVGNIRIRPI